MDPHELESLRSQLERAGCQVKVWENPKHSTVHVDINRGDCNFQIQLSRDLAQVCLIDGSVANFPTLNEALRYGSELYGLGWVEDPTFWDHL